MTPDAIAAGNGISRHCERSEAIQTCHFPLVYLKNIGSTNDMFRYSLIVSPLDCFVPRNDAARVSVTGEGATRSNPDWLLKIMPGTVYAKSNTVFNPVSAFW
jgi:hypothetical protein